jgi:hypothetical protein
MQNKKQPVPNNSDKLYIEFNYSLQTKIKHLFEPAKKNWSFRPKTEAWEASWATSNRPFFC